MSDKTSNFAVEYKGERHEIGQPGTKALVMMERHFGVGASSLQDDPRFEHMVYMAWVALKGRGVVSGAYGDDFLDDIELVSDDVEPSETPEADEDPTGETPAQQPA